MSALEIVTVWGVNLADISQIVLCFHLPRGRLIVPLGGLSFYNFSSFSRMPEHPKSRESEISEAFSNILLDPFFACGCGYAELVRIIQ
jgi:hypothetical protein